MEAVKGSECMNEVAQSVDHITGLALPPDWIDKVHSGGGGGGDGCDPMAVLHWTATALNHHCCIEPWSPLVRSSLCLCVL